MQSVRKSLTALLVGMCFYTCFAQGAVVVTIGAGSAVSSIDRSATFDSLNVAATGLDLSNYSEDSLDIWVTDTLYADFDAFAGGASTGFHYGIGGNNSYVTIETSDTADIFGLEFLLGHGSTGFLTANVVWETYDNGLLIEAGFIEDIDRGTIVGWSDAAGFDELRVGAHAAATSYNAFGQAQAIALDDVSVQLLAAPIPAALWLFGSGLIGLAGFARRQNN